MNNSHPSAPSLPPLPSLLSHPLPSPPLPLSPPLPSPALPSTLPYPHLPSLPPSSDTTNPLFFPAYVKTHRARKLQTNFPFVSPLQTVRAPDTEPPVSHYLTCPYIRAGWLPPRQILYCPGVEPHPAHRRWL